MKRLQGDLYGKEEAEKSARPKRKGSVRQSTNVTDRSVDFVYNPEMKMVKLKKKRIKRKRSVKKRLLAHT